MNDQDFLLDRPPPAAARAGVPLPAGSSAFATAPPSAQRPLRPSLSLVVPCRNEARNLETLLPLLLARLNRLAERWEVVLVDDGSIDDSVDVMRQWARRPGFTALQLSRNFGKEAALTAGLRQAQGAVVICMDADLQHPPHLLDEMLAQWRAGADVVYAVKTSRADEGRLKRWGSRAFYRLLNAFERFEVPADGGDFRLMDRAVVDALLALPERNRFMKGLYAWVGFQAVPLPYLPEERVHGRSHFHIRQLLGLSLDGLTAFTTWPLRLATVCGLVVALAAIGYGAYVAISYAILGNAVSGWTTIVVGMAVLLGLQMILLGIMGEYIGRIFEEVKGRPVYVVKRVHGHGLEAPGE